MQNRIIKRELRAIITIKWLIVIIQKSSISMFSYAHEFSLLANMQTHQNLMLTRKEHIKFG